MGNSLLTQVVLLVTSATIILTYIQPSFSAIADVQDDIARYETTVSKASELNAALGELVAAERSISASETRRLKQYLPNEIDDVLIMRDIQNIFKIVDIPITELNSASSDSFATKARVEGRDRGAVDETAPPLTFKDFQLSFFGTYDQLKSVLQGLEVNAFPLEVVELTFSSAPDVESRDQDIGLPPGVVRYDLTLRAFALPGAE